MRAGNDGGAGRLALGLLLTAGVACSGDEADPAPFDASGTGGSAPIGDAAGGDAPGGNAPGGDAPDGNAPAGSSGSSATPSSPSPGSPGSNGMGGAASAGTNNPLPGAGGSTPGASGAAPAGSGGMLAPAQPVGENDPPSLPDVECPAGASFCSGFETPALPMGARFDSNPMTTLAFDSTVFNSGGQSLSLSAVPDGFNIREVVVPIPGPSFWVRLFMRTDTVFGDNDHDSVFVASTTMGDNNSEDGVEFSEQGNQVLLNSNDQLFSAAGAGFPMAAGPTLEADTWHCLEGFFDGPSGDVQIFADGAALIDAPGYRSVTYQTFRFGYLQFPGGAPRSVWFDDVVVASDRIGCN
ncbi:MAG TPA: hypothetical protein VMG12_37270 [Polyangiaceae bacterium]|nr:hypothetical protein [Polyangiaceae bacterium]